MFTCTEEERGIVPPGREMEDLNLAVLLVSSKVAICVANEKPFNLQRMLICPIQKTYRR